MHLSIIINSFFVSPSVHDEVNMKKLYISDVILFRQSISSLILTATLLFCIYVWIFFWIYLVVPHDRFVGFFIWTVSGRNVYELFTLVVV